MNLEKMRLEEIKRLEGEIAENVVEKIKLAGKGRLEWIKASLSKSEDKPLSGKYTFITKILLQRSTYQIGTSLIF